ncbi:MAG: FkbM family methyltransferase [Myxococcales bacterium]|nr:FkbM family methyltransferase [Myxococcales bacterium]
MALLRSVARRIRSTLAQARYELAYLRPPKELVLPFGARWIARSDATGIRLRSQEGFEAGELAFLRAYLRPGMTVLDVGAHHGLYTLLAATMVGPGGRVIAFEPSPRELEHLQAHVRLNRLENVSLERLALGEGERSSDFYVCQGRETGCNSMRRPNVPDRLERIEVQVQSLDCYLERAGVTRVDWVKLDVEGAELEVLRGAKRVAAELRPVWMCELCDLRTEPWGYPSAAIFDELAAHRYGWFSVDLDGRLRPCERRERFHQNLVAIPEERVESMAGLIA